MLGKDSDTIRQSVNVPAAGVQLEGELVLPGDAHGIVLFAHGSGSGRHSPRNQHVARGLEEGGLATLLIDLLTREEEEVDIRTRHLRFDIGLLADRLAAVADWLHETPATRTLSIGLFGSSTGGGAALVAAMEKPDRISAVVSRGGRPDLAGDALPHVRAPTLLIVGSRDEAVIELNRAAMARMQENVRLEIVPGASHLFEEPDTLDVVTGLARGWFVQHLTPAPTRS